MADERKPVEIPAELAARIEELRSKYREVLPDRLAELRAAVQQARAQPGSLPEALAVAHRLAGTAGSYGFHRFGEACGAVEEALASTTLSPAGWSQVDAAFAEAEASVAAA